MGKMLAQRTIWGLKQYRRFVSPLLPSACRFHPTCSSYAVACFRDFGFFRAFFLSLKRVLRCHPYCEGGFDPAPDPS